MVKELKDQMNRTVRLEYPPRRIVSLVPSQTQLLHYFGLEDEVVGITKFCIHPKDWFRNKTRVGGTKNIKPKMVRELVPDLIIGNKEENLKDNILSLEGIAPIWMSDIYNLDDALEMIHDLGVLTGSSFIAEELIIDIQRNFRTLEHELKNLATTGKTALYYIWKDPDMVSGKLTFIDDMLTKCGLINACEKERYPNFEGDHEFNPDFIFLSSEPFPFKEKHIEAFSVKFPRSKIVIVNGEMFSWYGSMLKDAPNYFIQLLKELSL